MGEQQRYAGSASRRLDRLTDNMWHELTLAVMERKQRISADEPHLGNRERTAVLRDLEALLERLSR